MPVYEVIPHRGVGPVLLGMSCEQSRAAMGISCRPSKNMPSSTDTYLNNSFQIDFDEHDRVEFIELSNDEVITAIYKGQEVFKMQADDLVRFTAQDAPFDPDDPELGTSYTFPALDLALWRPVLPEGPDDPEGRYFATIAIGKQGYFSNRS